MKANRNVARTEYLSQQIKKSPIGDLFMFESYVLSAITTT